MFCSVTNCRVTGGLSLLLLGGFSVGEQSRERNAELFVSFNMMTPWPLRVPAPGNGIALELPTTVQWCLFPQPPSCKCRWLNDGTIYKIEDKLAA